MPPPCPAHYHITDVRTNTAHVPITTPPFCHCTSASCEHARSVAAPSHHLLSSLMAQPVLLLRNAWLQKEATLYVLSASGKPSPPHSPLFSTTSSVPGHLTPPLSPYVGPRASPEPRAAPQLEGPAPSRSLSSGVVDHAGQFHPSIARLPRYELELSIMSDECPVGCGSL
jgi:hypothetical protein